ncbi:hypothetical protein [Streptomyces sp. RKND-216]|uniref:hypothetical protein n=1 Tax=Streptomyces sp. RKND-216 TaxID=2562581 RepID=UPI001447305B|nr:hypothetical protein [Streptomyces sp. RKND-216]
MIADVDDAGLVVDAHPERVAEAHGVGLRPRVRGAGDVGEADGAVSRGVQHRSVRQHGHGHRLAHLGQGVVSLGTGARRRAAFDPKKAHFSRGRDKAPDDR